VDFFKFLRNIKSDAHIAEFPKSIKGRPASQQDIEYLKKTEYPADIIAFFVKNEPLQQMDEAGVRFGLISDMRIENEGAVPGIAAAPVGYLNIASTMYGDTYCVDINSTGTTGLHPIVMVSHDEVDEDTNPDDIHNGIKKICESFQEFLERFCAHSLPIDFYKAE